MRIIVWGINYVPELTGIAPYNAALCEFLKSRGHKAEMVTGFGYYPEWRKREEDKGRWFRTDFLKGVPVHRCWLYVPGKPSTLRRILHEFSFVAMSFLRILTLPRPDIFVVVSPPLALGLAAWLASLCKRAPYVFHVQDLQPDGASNLGMLGRSALLRVLYALEWFSYKKAACVSGITPGMIQTFEKKGVPRAKRCLFANGVELPSAASLPCVGQFRQRMKISPEDLLVVYSGNIGVKHGVEILLEAARRLTGRKIRIVICGDGARRAFLEQQANEIKLSNVTFLPLQPEDCYMQMLVDTDVYVVTQQASSGSFCYPSKLLKGLAMSKPILIVADAQSELRRAARKGGFAVLADPGHPEEVAAALEFLAEHPKQRKFMGEAGRAYVKQFDLGLILGSFEARLTQIVHQRQGQPERAPRVQVQQNKPESAVIYAKAFHESVQRCADKLD